MPNLLRLGLAIFLIGVSMPAAAQQVTISKTSAVYSDANPSSSKVGELKEGSTAEVVGRQGAFVNVKSGATSGWVFAFNVNFGSSGAASSPSRKPSAASATIGIRGLDKDAMTNAQFDGKQLDSLDAFSGDKPTASRKK